MRRMRNFRELKMTQTETYAEVTIMDCLDTIHDNILELEGRIKKLEKRSGK